MFLHTRYTILHEFRLLLAKKKKRENRRDARRKVYSQTFCQSTETDMYDIWTHHTLFWERIRSIFSLLPSLVKYFGMDLAIDTRKVIFFKYNLPVKQNSGTNSIVSCVAGSSDDSCRPTGRWWFVAGEVA